MKCLKKIPSSIRNTRLRVLPRIAIPSWPVPPSVMSSWRARRGPLVMAALEAWHGHVQAMAAAAIATGTMATVTPMTLQCTAVKKNPCVVHYLRAMVALDPLWLNYPVDVLQADIRQLGVTAAAALGPDMTIVVLELLGSFGCNELSPECLNAFLQHFANPERIISIPAWYTLYLAPISALHIHQEIVHAQSWYPAVMGGASFADPCTVGITKALETPYVIRTHAASQMLTEQACWSFVHGRDAYGLAVAVGGGVTIEGVAGANTTSNNHDDTTWSTIVEF